MRRTNSGILVPDEVHGWNTRPDHNWADSPILLPGRKGKEPGKWRPIAGGSRQYFVEVLAPIATADQTAVVGTTEVALWPVSPWTATVANQPQPGQIYRLTAAGVMTTAGSSPGTLTITPRWGTTTGGTSLGASAASATLTVSKTNVPWFLEAIIIFRTLGTTGTMFLAGNFECDQAGVNSLNFGGPSTTVDTTTAQGIFLGVTLGSASDSMTTRLPMLECVN